MSIHPFKVLPTVAAEENQAQTGGWGVVGFGTSFRYDPAHILTAVTDGSDTTYIQNSRSDVQSEVGFSWSTPAVPALSQIRVVILYVRLSPSFVLGFAQSATESLVFDFVSHDSTSYSSTISVPITQNASDPIPNITDNLYALPGAPKGAVGGIWDPSIINGLDLFLFGPSDPTAGSRFVNIYELELWLEVNEAPTLTIAVDANPETTTQRPTMTWTYSDPESDVQERIEYRWYAIPPGGWGSFNPDTTTQSPALSEILFTTSNTYRVPQALNNDTYRLYMRACDAGSAGRFGAWTSLGVSMQVPLPVKPVITVNDDASHGQIVGSVTITGPTTQPFGVIIQRLDDSGNWQPVMECGDLAVHGGTAGNGWVWSAAWRDRAAPRDRVLIYRGVTIGADNDIFSPGAAVQTILPDDGSTWLILGSTNNSMDMACVQIGGAGNFMELSDEDQFAFTPEGRTNYVVNHGTIHGKYQSSSTGLQFGFPNDAARANFEKLRAQQLPILVKTRFGDIGDGLYQFWMTIGKTVTLKPIGSGTRKGGSMVIGQQWIAQMPFYQVDQPAI